MPYSYEQLKGFFKMHTTIVCTLHAFEQFRALYVYNFDEKQVTRPDWMNHRGPASHTSPILFFLPVCVCQRFWAAEHYNNLQIISSLSLFLSPFFPPSV